MKAISFIYIFLIFSPMFFLFVEFTADSKINCQESKNIKQCFIKFFRKESQIGEWLHSASFFVNKSIFKKNIISNVHFGKDNWLFYASTIDGDPIADLRGKPYSTDQNKNILNYYKKMDLDYLKLSAPYLGIVVPNKSRVFEGKLNLGISRQSLAPYLPVIEALEETLGNSFISPKEIIEEMNIGNYPSYYQFDTHWNLLGASIVIDWIVQKKNFFQRPIKIPVFEFQESELQTPHDLLSMLNLKELIKLENRREKIPMISNSCTKESEVESEIIFYNCPQSSGRILIIGDSFRTSFARVISESFEETYSVHYTKINDFINMFPNLKIDYVIEITAERNLKHKK